MLISNFDTDSFYNIDGVKLYHGNFNLNWFKELNIEPKNIIDVGAYDCGDSVRFKKFFPNCNVYAFEACPKRSVEIQKYIRQFQVMFFERAVSDNNEKNTFFQSKDNFVNEITTGSQGSLFKHTDSYKNSYNYISQTNEVQVQCITLKKFCLENNIEHIDLLYIDAEGAELQVLNGLFHHILPKLIYLESMAEKKYWDNGYDFNQVYELLSKFNYELIKSDNVNKLYLKK